MICPYAILGSSNVIIGVFIADSNYLPVNFEAMNYPENHLTRADLGEYSNIEIIRKLGKKAQDLGAAKREYKKTYLGWELIK
jgi:hypothetical protein